MATCRETKNFVQRRHGFGAATQQRRKMSVDFEMLLAAVVIGLLGGGVAGIVLKTGGHGLLQDLAIALARSTLATWILQAARGSSDMGIPVTSVVAFIGAVSLIVAQRKLWRAHA
jgi:uncharacterized membrane protein YeaQ/YmgE (transglycosylase-associated protein family)